MSNGNYGALTLLLQTPRVALCITGAEMGFHENPLNWGFSIFLRENCSCSSRKPRSIISMLIHRADENQCWATLRSRECPGTRDAAIVSCAQCKVYKQTAVITLSTGHNGRISAWDIRPCSWAWILLLLTPHVGLCVTGAAPGHDSGNGISRESSKLRFFDNFVG